MALKFGSCAIGIYEPGQGRNAAAIRRISYVPQGCLAELTAKVTCISSPTYRIFLYVGEHSVRMRTARVRKIVASQHALGAEFCKQNSILYTGFSCRYGNCIWREKICDVIHAHVSAAQIEIMEKLDIVVKVRQSV